MAAWLKRAIEKTRIRIRGSSSDESCTNSPDAKRPRGEDESLNKEDEETDDEVIVGLSMTEGVKL